jgi:hypothetical protein
VSANSGAQSGARFCHTGPGALAFLVEQANRTVAPAKLLAQLDAQWLSG